MDKKIAYYALFYAHPASEPPFNIELGFGDGSTEILKDCEHIPAGMNKMIEYCKNNSVDYSPDFTLLYPIYMDAMGTSAEGSMHSIAWLIKDEADAKKWKFDRIGGYTGNTPQSFLPKNISNNTIKTDKKKKKPPKSS